MIASNGHNTKYDCVGGIHAALAAPDCLAGQLYARRPVQLYGSLTHVDCARGDLIILG